ncbi:hypothetical protein BDN71DRAFT_525869 [Pleurotus eryngii]|uniref:F-box domain-containing protein n=1 Tax=Pleurotus eryngii TaxID=5323 RepID=A0A9P6D9Z2_PLEER|nr:hypothetical protein BDN71DRAFT_525869 [Pleurotus eryngii]
MSTMVHHSPSLPVEIVALVFEHIGDAPTLLGCLALSRSLQHYAEQALYADISFVLSLSHLSVPQLRSHADEKDDSDTRRWSRGRIHGALALSGFRSAITQKPCLRKLTTRLTVHVLSPFTLFTPFYLDLNKILPMLTNLKYLDMRWTSPPSASQQWLPPLSLWTLPPPEFIFSLSHSLHRARSQGEDADFPALAIAHTAPTSLKTLVLRDVGVPWGFIRRQRALENLEVSGRMLDSAEEFSAEDQGDPKPQGMPISSPCTCPTLVLPNPRRRLQAVLLNNRFRARRPARLRGSAWTTPSGKPHATRYLAAMWTADMGRQGLGFRGVRLVQVKGGSRR